MWLVVAAATNQLGANPAEALIRSTGDWPCARCAWCWPDPAARGVCRAGWRGGGACGAVCVFYAFLHVLSYSWLDMGLDVPDILADIAKRPFILVGTLAFVVLLALAATSFQRAIQALGGKRWQALHRTGVRRRFAGGAAFLLDARWQKQLCRSGGVRRHHRDSALGWRLWRRLVMR